MDEKKRDQLLSELLEIQKKLEKKVQHQNQMIRKFQMLTANVDLLSQIIDYCPYPIAVFTSQGILEVVNNAFIAEAKANKEDIEIGKISIYNCISDDIELYNAIRQALNGKIRFLEGLKNPFLRCLGTKHENNTISKNYKKVIVFPIPSDYENSAIMHGVIVFTI